MLELTILENLPTNYINQICWIDQLSQADQILLPEQEIWTPAYIECLLDNPKQHRFILGMQDGDLLGYMLWRPIKDESTGLEIWVIDWVAVTPEFQRRGIASKLLGKLLERAFEDQPFALRAIVRESLFPALALLRGTPPKHGFQVESQLSKNHWQTGEDAVLFAIALPNRLKSSQAETV